ncbi:MAG: ExbD/TolR family protein [Puniceicoccaceae bacterium]
MNLKEVKRRRAEVNIVPLVDVLMVLIFFFMMTMQFRSERVLNIEPPEIETAGENRKVEMMTIALDRNGTLYLNGAELPAESLKQALEVQARIDRKVPILIVADERAELGGVTQIIDWCRKSGLNSFRLQAR